MRRKRALLAAIRTTLTLTLAALLLPAAQGEARPEQAAIEKARSLEGRGLSDLAAQAWQQVLLAQPENTEALAGLARAAKQQGKEAEADRYLERLRRLHPNDPQLSAIGATLSNKTKNERRAQAEALAANHDYAAAMKIYRQTYGDHPMGDVALEYYDTEAATEGGRPHAIAGLRELARQHPRDARYQVTLGRVLSYSANTRTEGEGILQQWPQDAGAQSALRQALLWDAQNPGSASAIKTYLQAHPDQELARHLQETEARQSRQPKGLAITQAEQAAYAALQANQVQRAEQEFQAILGKQPTNPRALAGIGFVHMKQNHFDQAVNDFEAARQNGLKDHAVDTALGTARFWRTMGEGDKALGGNQMDKAIQRYREALALRQGSPEALGGLAGALLRSHQTSEAGLVYGRWVRLQPASAAAWRGLFIATQQAGQPQQALQLTKRFPKTVTVALAADPEYLLALATAYRAAGDEAKASQTLTHAMDLGFADNGQTMTPALRMQYAALLAAAGRQQQAAGLYREVITAEPENADAWSGLILAQHTMHDDEAAVHSLERMPATAFAASGRDPGFLSMAAAAFQQQGQSERAQQLLVQAETLLAQRGSQPGIEMQLQMAAIESQLEHWQAAAALYRRVIEADAQRTDAWSGLLATLHQSGEDGKAFAELARMPAPMLLQLSANDDSLLTLSAIYSASGHARLALAALKRLQQRSSAQHAVPPADVEMQMSWLLLRAGEDSDLYYTLMRLGARNDLTDEQRKQVQNLWATWSVGRAAQASAAGNTRHALVILNAAREALGGNEQVSRSLAGGYLAAGDAPSALALYQSVDLASSSDYQGAVGAALAAKNLRQAETWLRLALDRYPKDPKILGLAARFEEARGDHGKARAYWQASLAAAPDTGAPDRLANTLHASISKRVGPLPAADTLAALLGPDAPEPRKAFPLPGESEAAPVLIAPAEPLTPSGNAFVQPNAGPASKLRDYHPMPAEGSPKDPGLHDAGPSGTAESSPARESLDPSPHNAHLSNEESLHHDTGVMRTVTYATALAPAPEPERVTPQQEVPPPTGLTDDQLAEAHLPALSRNYVPVAPASSLTAHQEAQQQIASIDGGFSPWVGGTGDVHHRSGTPGFDQLTALSAPFEVSAPLGTAARLTLITTPVFLDGGVADGTSTLNFGTLASGKMQPQQYADGVASELQLTAVNFAARVGQTPYGFLVTNVTGGVRWRPAGGPLTLSFTREAVKDTQLSWSGLRDPGSATATFDGNIWGGVIANGGDLQMEHGDALSGFYVGVGGQYLTGQHVLTNTRFHGNAGAYWHVLTLPDVGQLVLGANFFGMHYAHNLRYFTYGQGGYFSPEAYFLASMPLSWTGHYGTDLHYTITGSIGAQSFQENSEPYFPLDRRLQASFKNPLVPVQSVVGANYDLQTEVAYRLQDHWYVGGFLDFNNTRDYESQSGGFFVRYLFRPQAESSDGPIGAFPRDGYRPVMVP